MTIQRMEHVGIVVDDLAAATAFFVAAQLSDTAADFRRERLSRIHPSLAGARAPGASCERGANTSATTRVHAWVTFRRLILSVCGTFVAA